MLFSVPLSHRSWVKRSLLLREPVEVPSVKNFLKFISKGRFKDAPCSAGSACYICTQGHRLTQPALPLVVRQPRRGRIKWCGRCAGGYNPPQPPLSSFSTEPEGDCQNFPHHPLPRSLSHFSLSLPATTPCAPTPSPASAASLLSHPRRRLLEVCKHATRELGDRVLCTAAARSCCFYVPPSFPDWRQVPAMHLRELGSKIHEASMLVNI
ncbi:hypothetical protein GN956_G8750 [Arapaima gigas]